MGGLNDGVGFVVDVIVVENALEAKVTKFGERRDEIASWADQSGRELISGWGSRFVVFN